MVSMVAVLCWNACQSGYSSGQFSKIFPCAFTESLPSSQHESSPTEDAFYKMANHTLHFASSCPRLDSS